jgi:predicted Zn-dependent protease
MDRAQMLDESFVNEVDDLLIEDMRSQANDNDGNLILAMVLMRSIRIDHRREAGLILEKLLRIPRFERRVDAIYSLALTLYSLDEYERSRVLCEELLREMPDMTQVQHLHEAVVYKHNNKKQREEYEQAGLITIGVGLAASIAIVAFALGGKKK